jgi:hypothetical protein
MSAGVGGDRGASNTVDEGPILLSLNPPLLHAPLQSEAARGFAPSESRNEDEDRLAADGTSALDKSQEPRDTEEAEPTENLSQPEPELLPLGEEMIALRERVRRTLAFHGRQRLNTRDNTAAQVMQVCLAFGCDAEVRRGGSSGSGLNGFACLCWNYPCAGYRLLRIGDGRIIARIGYGLQEHPAQFLALLALARVPCEYPLRVGEDARTVDDLVQTEKLGCRPGTDLSFKLIGLARYVGTDQTWENDLGRQWSVERLIREELARKDADAPNGGTQRLMALSYAVDRRLKSGKPLAGQFRRADNYVKEYQTFALKLQNPDGSWHPRFFATRGDGGTRAERLNSTGRILQWLVFSLPDDRLQDPQIVRAVGYVMDSLGGTQRRRSGISSADSRDIAGRMHALHALSIYDQRVFKPRDPKPDAEEGDKVAGTVR